MNKIQGVGSNLIETLSHEVYLVEKDIEISNPKYQKGAFVRLISGVDNNKTPGYHFNNDFATVCSIKSCQAEYVGIPKENLRQVLAEELFHEPINKSGFQIVKESKFVLTLQDEFGRKSIWKAVVNPKFYAVIHNDKLFEFYENV